MTLPIDGGVQLVEWARCSLIDNSTRHGEAIMERKKEKKDALKPYEYTHTLKKNIP